ncbi:hypothetical protein C8J98_10460 [Luteibacter sp. OK325]|jgi:hypothetical protein|uniref:hypothetical protein n=1 Tax=Luteibacter sp. OK325 TaxID=2135670 RepID=UPI000D3B6653|nr:hypothetical protein [Luteibacter sp. OK325]PTR32852.1 hypothetical protein C8J98_10460 [Luteibacter sp. OK325]
MVTSTTSSLRRFASTFFVFIALFVACMGVQAVPCDRDTGHDSVAGYVAALVADDGSQSTEDDTLPSLEDNSGGLDDTFDVPTEHAMSVPRLVAAGHLHVVPAPHAHHPSLDLRPPIA